MITKLKFSIPQKTVSLQHKNYQEYNHYDRKTIRKNTQVNAKDLLVPIDKLAKNIHSKPIRSQQKSTSKQKMPAVDLFTIKNSFLLQKDRQSLELKSLSKKKATTNRIYTQKGRNQVWMELEKQTINPNKKSVHKILMRGGFLKSKQSSPNRKATSNEKLIFFDSQQIKNDKHGSKKHQKRNLSAFEKQQMSKYQEILYVGPRRIHHKNDFTDQQGDPKIAIGDSIAYRYEIIIQLGRGSFGQVYKAFDHKKKQLVALKIIKSQQKFIRQAKVQVQILQCALLNDPKLKCNLVRMKGSFIFRGHSCITFQILHKNLYQFLKETNFSGFSLDLIRRFSIQILQCLLFFSNHKIVHCDLKPENILLKQQNKSGIKVIDVGSGCYQSKQIYTYIQSRFYRAPEIILGVRYTPAIDMWSFGCILIELFTGFPIFPGDSQNQQMLMFMQILGQPPYSMLEIAERRKKFFNESFECKITQQKGKQRIPGSLNLRDVVGSSDRNFLNLIKRCLQWDPTKRITPKQALLHEWIVTGLPHTIRGQHIEQITQQHEE